MDVPPVLLEVLKCDTCHDYLSYSPVYLKNNGFTLCGKCFSSETEQEAANRILQYEAAAKLLKFPCRYRIYGCQETVPFSEDDREKPHEEGCEFRNYQCPVGADDCDWVGLRKSLLGHFQARHPENIACNPCHLMYDITHFLAKTYIVHCFDVIFLIHSKVCIATGKIYHAVRLLDNPVKITHFKYTLDIKREELIISRPGTVVPQNHDGVDEKSAIVTNISSMLDFLNGFSGTIFTIKIQKVVQNIPKPIQETSSLVNLEKLQIEVMKRSTSTPKLVDFIKSRSSPAAAEVVKSSTSSAAVEVVKSSTSSAAVEGRSCRNKYRGCTFSDTEVKCDKHEEFFCPLRTWCWSCWTPIIKPSEDAWQLHYSTCHDNHTFQGGVVFTITTTGESGRSIYIKTHIGVVHCRFIFQPKILRVYVWSASTSKLLKRYKCSLTVIEPGSSKIATFILDKQFGETWDWFVKLEKENLPLWSNKFDVTLQITKAK